MANTGVKAGDGTQNSFFKIKSHAVSEILAAGGTEAFAAKMGQQPQNLAIQLKKLPKEAFLTSDEANLALEVLETNK